jgi:hypothetical protein
MYIRVWVDFKTEFGSFDVDVEPERYIEAMDIIRKFCEQHGGQITRESIRISVKDFTVSDDTRIVELFKKNPKEFIKKAEETENDPNVLTREDVISKLLGKSVSVKESKIILREQYYYYSAYVVLDKEVWGFAYVEVPTEHKSALKEHFEVTNDRVRSKELAIMLELDYSELLQVKDVVPQNKDKIKRIFELINEGLGNAQRNTKNEYRKLVKRMLLDGNLNELEKILEERARKVKKEAEKREKRQKALEEVKYKVVETPIGYLHASSWSLELIREEDDDIVLYTHSGSESEIAQKVYSIRNGRLPKLDERISFKAEPDKFAMGLHKDLIDGLKTVAPELYLKLKLLGVIR